MNEKKLKGINENIRRNDRPSMQDLSLKHIKEEEYTDVSSSTNEDNQNPINNYDSSLDNNKRINTPLLEQRRRLERFPEEYGEFKGERIGVAIDLKTKNRLSDVVRILTRSRNSKVVEQHMTSAIINKFIDDNKELLEYIQREIYRQGI